MPRGLVVILVIAVITAVLLWFLSRQAGEVPTQPIEVEVNAPGNAL